MEEFEFGRLGEGLATREVERVSTRAFLEEVEFHGVGLLGGMRRKFARETARDKPPALLRAHRLPK
jgi:hypothetical protein